MSTFFICSLAYSEPCPTPNELQPAEVKWVYDGDTLKLKDGRKLRIIGIDAPEVAHQHKKAEAFGGQATEALRALLKKHQYKIHILSGKQKRDKYGRLLAHVFTPDQTNVSQWLLQQGLATSLIIPPNEHYSDCYRHAEKVAQRNKARIWKLPHFQVQNTADLDTRYTGYVRLTGTVKRIKRRKNKISIQLANQIYITIKEPELQLFSKMLSSDMKDRKIKVTGLLYRHGKRRYIRVRHPAYLEHL